MSRQNIFNNTLIKEIIKPKIDTDYHLSKNVEENFTNTNNSRNQNKNTLKINENDIILLHRVLKK